MEGVASKQQPELTTTTDNGSVDKAAAPSTDDTSKPMSKNALKRMRKQQEWEDGKEDRRKRRKEKRQETRVRKREDKAALVAQGIDPQASAQPKQPAVNVPVSLIFDCDFEQYMLEKELVSLGAQITRSYSANRNSKFRSHLLISNWNGKLAKRFHDVLEDKHENWKGVQFLEGDFIACAEKAREDMTSGKDVIPEVLQKSIDEKVPWVRDEAESLPLPDPEPEPRDEYKDMVYLSSDSPYTLERLEPNTSYIIGGLVDKNREKGLCYKRARQLGIRTARLPIGQYMVMSSRAVLATNHVVEIMLRWLECGNWADAFLSVMPKRKGGRLRGQDGEGDEYDENEHEDEGHGEEDAEANNAVDDDLEQNTQEKDVTTKS